MDPLSDVLSLLKPRSYVSGAFGVGGDLALRFGRHEGIKCYAIVSGQCWLSLEGMAGPVLLTAGDCFLLPSGRPFTLATDPALPPIDFFTYRAALESGEIAPYSGDRGGYLAGGHFILAGSHAEILLGALPPIVHIQKESDKAAMRWSLERMREELHEPQLGGSLIMQQLVYMMLVQALRLHLTEGLKGGVGWLFALADKQMSAAIHAMHEDPARRWTLQELAGRIGMSRSTFALRFKETVGTSPMEYLTRWRMLLAADRLVNSTDPLSAIALSLGYKSESAFSTAFKRVMGCSPRQYSRAQGSAAPSSAGKESRRADQLQLAAS